MRMIFLSKVMEIFSRTFIFLWVFLVSIDFYWKQIILIFISKFFFYVILDFMNIYS